MPVAVITGASAGIGRACVRAFARAGYDVGLLARGFDGLEAARHEVEREGRRGVVVQADVADAVAVDAAASSVEDELGEIDVWVNNAMATVFARFLDMTPEEFARTTDVTYLGFVNGTRAALARMVPRNRGTVVQVGSALAYRGIPLQSAYCGAKHAIQGFTESVRCELLHDGSRVHVTSVHLPAVNTPQFDIQRNKMSRRPQPVPPIYQPETIAEEILHAAQVRRRELWVGGTTVATIVANRLVPGLLDLYLARTGFEAQQRDEPADAGAPDALFEPVPGDQGAHGSFDAGARRSSMQARLSHNRLVSEAVSTVTAGLEALLGRSRR